MTKHKSSKQAQDGVLGVVVLYKKGASIERGEVMRGVKMMMNAAWKNNSGTIATCASALVFPAAEWTCRFAASQKRAASEQSAFLLKVTNKYRFRQKIDYKIV